MKSIREIIWQIIAEITEWLNLAYTNVVNLQ